MTRTSFRPRTVLLTAILAGTVAAVGLRADTMVLDPPSVSWPDSDDILTDRGPFPSLPRLAVPGPAIGLGPQDVIDAMSDGDDILDAIEATDFVAIVGRRPALLFSVRRAALGAPGSAVESERLADSGFPAGGFPNGHASDLFLWRGTAGTNTLAPAPHGWRSNDGDESRARLRIPNGNPGDDVNAYDASSFRAYPTGLGGFDPRNDNQVWDPDNVENPGNPGGGVGANYALLKPIFFSLRTGSPTLAAIGASPGDILVAGGAYGSVPSVFIDTAALGIPVAADVNALSMKVDIDTFGNAVADKVRFSVHTSSVPFPVAGQVVNSGAVVLEYDGATTTIAHRPNELGLRAGDDIDALEGIEIGFDLPWQPWEPLGDAEVVPEGSGVAVGNIGSSGRDGVRFRTPQAVSYGRAVSLNDSLAGNSTINCSAGATWFTADGSEEVPLASWELRPLGLEIEQTATYSCADRVAVEVFDGDESVLSVAEVETAVPAFFIQGSISSYDVEVELVALDAGLLIVSTFRFGGQEGEDFGLGGQEGEEFRIGDETAFGDRVVLRALCNNENIPVWRSGVAVTALEFRARGIDGFDSHGTRVRRGAILTGTSVAAAVAAASGAAFVERDAGGLTVSEIGSSGQDGVRMIGSSGMDGVVEIGSSGIDGFQIDLDEIELAHDGAFGAGASFEFAGALSGGNGSADESDQRAWLGAVGPRSMGMEIDWGDGVSGVDVVAYSGGDVTAEVAASSGTVIPFAGRARLVGANVSAHGFAFRFAGPISLLDPASGGLVTADEFHFLRPVGSGGVAGLDDGAGLEYVDILAANLESFRILDPITESAPVFRRGDADGNGSAELSDAIRVLGFLFQGTAAPDCLDAADSNDSGGLDIGDPIHLLGVLFLGTDVVPAPGRLECGIDPTADALTCDAYDACD